MNSHGHSSRDAGVIAPALPGFGRAFITPAVPVQADARPIGAYQATLFDAEQTGAFAPNKTIVAQGQHGRISSGEHKRHTLTSDRRLALPVCGCSGVSAPSSRPAGIAPHCLRGTPYQQTRAAFHSARNLAGAFVPRLFSFEG
jgi:hypothetical protein